MVLCGRLSWLFALFRAHVNIVQSFVSYSIVPYQQLQKRNIISWEHGKYYIWLRKEREKVYFPQYNKIYVGLNYSNKTKPILAGHPLQKI